MTTRQRTIDVDAHLNDPSMERIRRELANTVRVAHEEIDEKGGNFENEAREEEQSFVPNPEMLNPNRARGPMANRERQARIDAVMSQALPPPRRQNTIRQDFNPDNPEDTSEVLSNDPDRFITNDSSNRSDGPVSAPEISDVQRLEKMIKDQQEEIAKIKSGEKSETTDGKKAVSRLASRRINYDSNYQSIMPTSQCVFYLSENMQDLQIKKINVPTQEKITDAKRSEDISAFIDAIASTLKDVDIRDVTPEDWFYILYWHKYNSYNRTPLVLTWDSKYGNRNQYIIKESDLKYVYPSINKETYKSKYVDKGIVVPTLREWELLNTNSDLSSEDRDILIRAQYFEGNSLEEKVDNYFKLGDTVECLELIEELKKEMVHGVVHTVDVIDEKFNPKEYVKDRSDYLESLIADSNVYKNEPALYYAYKEEIDRVTKEVETMQKTLADGGQVRAEVETQPVRFNALDMFPLL